jgi:hypothetical protein
VIAAAILFGGMPIVCRGATPETRPTISFDICHPIQTIGTAAAGCSLPILAASAIKDDLQETGFAPAGGRPLVVLAAEPPDPPPPKSTVLL